MAKARKVCTFNKIMSPEEAQREKTTETSLGESLRQADKLYERRKRR